MLSRGQTQELLRSVDSAFDHSDPNRWKSVVSKVIQSDKDPWTSIPQGSREPGRHDRFLTQYLTWKRFLSKCALQNGQAFGRVFWQDLLHPLKRQVLAASDPRALLGEELLFEITLALANDEPFSNSCATTLMSEMVQEWMATPFTRAEEVNDAGFGQHHPGGYANAQVLHEQAIGLSPQFSLAWINKGIALKNLDRLEEAIECYDHVINYIDADYKKAWHNKGVALMHLGRHEDALLSFDRALAIDSQYESAKRAREHCARLVNQVAPPTGPDELINRYARQLAEHPHAAQLWQMAQALRENGNVEAAERLLQQALALLPDNPLMLSWRADSLFHLQQYDEAEKQLLQAIEIAPTIAPFWTDLCRCRLERRDFSAALEAADEAVRLAPMESMGWANRAAALTGLGRYTDGNNSARQGTELDPRNAWAWLHLGQTAWLLDLRPEAARAFEHLLIVCPDFPQRDRVDRMLQIVREGK